MSEKSGVATEVPPDDALLLGRTVHRVPYVTKVKRTLLSDMQVDLSCG
jgi:hypothetical protein